MSSPETALHPNRPQLGAASGLWGSRESPGTQSPQPRARIRTNFMLVLAGALHSGQLVLNCSTWGGKRQPQGPSQPRAAGLGVPERPWLCSCPHLVPQVLGSVRRLRVHLLSLQGQQSQALLPAGALGSRARSRGCCSHLQAQQGALLRAPPVVSDQQGLVPLRCPRVLHEAVPRGVIQDLQDKEP